jgi:hypothetical protein
MKVWNYLIIMITLLIFLEFVGVHTGGGILLNKVGISINQENSILETSDIQQSEFYDDLFGAGGILILVLTAGAVIVGFFTKSFEWKLVLAPFMTGVVITFVSAGVSIINYARTTGEHWLIAVISTIFLPLTIGFVYSVFEWFGGSE